MNRRGLGAACLGLAAAAGLLWWASAAVWYRLTPPGRAPVAIEGAAARPELTAVALVALAGIAAVVATAGVVRRVLGGLLGAAGAAVAVVATLGLFAPAIRGSPPSGGPPDVAGPSAAAVPPPGAAVGPASDGGAAAPHLAVSAAPLLAVAGGVLLVAVGVFVLLKEPLLARFGARYAATGAREAGRDPDRAAWAALDEGRDPTADPADETDDPGVSGAGGAV